MADSLPASPVVSIIIPARNEERQVTTALASIAAQTWPAALLDVVVVNNGSSDATAAMVREFMAREPHLAVQLLDEPVQGRARAKNRGVKAARGDWLIFLDADSRMAPNLVERVVARAHAGCQAGSIRVVADSHDHLDRAFFDLIELGKHLFNVPAQMFYCSQALFARLSGFDEEILLAEDREFLIRLQQAGTPICLLTESWIATSTRRLRARPWRLGMLTMLGRWALANWGIGRRWRY